MMILASLLLAGLLAQVNASGNNMAGRFEARVGRHLASARRRLVNIDHTIPVWDTVRIHVPSIGSKRLDNDRRAIYNLGWNFKDSDSWYLTHEDDCKITYLGKAGVKYSRSQTGTGLKEEIWYLVEAAGESKRVGKRVRRAGFQQGANNAIPLSQDDKNKKTIGWMNEENFQKLIATLADSRESLSDTSSVSSTTTTVDQEEEVADQIKNDILAAKNYYETRRQAARRDREQFLTKERVRNQYWGQESTNSLGARSKKVFEMVENGYELRVALTDGVHGRPQWMKETYPLQTTPDGRTLYQIHGSGEIVEVL